MKKFVAATAASLVLMLGAVEPAHALFGVGDIVFDPANLAQNLLTAAHTLEEVNNQILQLQNEAQMLINEANNLKGLDFNSLQQLLATIARTEQLFDQVQGLAYDVGRVRDQFAQLYPVAYDAAVSHDQLNADSTMRWSNSREALGTALQMQAQARQNFPSDEQVLSDLISHSQAAVGALQATQATNQLLALQARQLMQGQQLQIAQDRATSLEQARAVAAEARAQELRRRFMTENTLYTPQPVKLFE